MREEENAAEEGVGIVILSPSLAGKQVQSLPVDLLHATQAIGGNEVVPLETNADYSCSNSIRIHVEENS